MNKPENLNVPALPPAPPQTIPPPVKLVLHSKSKIMEIHYTDGKEFNIPYELLRVYSPSAEFQGHGPGQETLQYGKKNITIEYIDPIGHYAILIHFDDGHNTGIYTWEYLYMLGLQKEKLLNEYIEKLKKAGLSRDPQ